LVPLTLTAAEESNHKRVSAGMITLSGYASSVVYSLNADGSFTIPRVFPGTYEFSFQAFGYANVVETVTISEETTTVGLISHRLY